MTDDRDPKPTGEILIVRFREKWALRLDHDEKPFAFIPSRDEAIEKGRMLARVAESELVITNEDGDVEARESFSQRSLPPSSRPIE